MLIVIINKRKLDSCQHEHTTRCKCIKTMALCHALGSLCWRNKNNLSNWYSHNKNEREQIDKYFKNKMMREYFEPFCATSSRGPCTLSRFCWCCVCARYYYVFIFFFFCLFHFVSFFHRILIYRPTGASVIKQCQCFPFDRFTKSTHVRRILYGCMTIFVICEI